VFYPAKAKISGSTVVIYSSKVKKPVAVRFAFTNGALPNLYNVEGLPASAFRTDNWELAQH
ncbi:MAG: sialate O-acetylesterase, partial [Arenibacter sp.]|nr:sialate O-acetylesterase [Arenibacter sp.]